MTLGISPRCSVALLLASPLLPTIFRSTPLGLSGFSFSKKIQTSPFGSSFSVALIGRTNYVTLGISPRCSVALLLASPLLPTIFRSTPLGLSGFSFSKKIQTSPFGSSFSVALIGRTNYVTLGISPRCSVALLLASPLLPTIFRTSPSGLYCEPIYFPHSSETEKIFKACFQQI